MKKLLFLAFMLAAFPSSAQVYLGVGGGQSEAMSISCDPGLSCDKDPRETAWKGFAGYQINKYLAAELSYVDLGTAKVNESGQIWCNTAMASGRFKVDGVSLDAVGSVPIVKNLTGLVRAGAFYWRMDEQAQASVGSMSGTARETPKGTTVDAGFGLEYRLLKNVALRAEYQRFFNVGNDSTGKSDIDLASASLLYRF